MTLNETNCDWLFDMSVKRPHGRALANKCCHLFQTFSHQSEGLATRDYGWVYIGLHSFLQCIVELNECTREHPLWFRTPLKMAVPLNSALFEGIGGNFGYSQRLMCRSWMNLCFWVESVEVNDSWFTQSCRHLVAYRCNLQKGCLVTWTIRAQPNQI